MAVGVCRKVVELAEQTGNCGVCGNEFGNHDDACMYADAIMALELLGVELTTGDDD